MNVRRIKVAAVSAAACMAVGVAGTVAIARHVRKRKRRRGGFLSNKKRQTITEALELAAGGLPHGPAGATLFRRHLERLSDKRLLTLYAALRVGEFVRDSGIDPAQASAEQLEGIRARFSGIESGPKRDREGIVGALLAHDLEDLKPLLVAALAVLALL